MKFTKSLAAFTAAALACSLTGCSSSASSASGSGYTGTQTASAKGMESDVEVTITWENGTITNCEINADGETESIGKAAAPDLAAAIIEANDYEIDGVSGATVTSEAVKTAAKECFTAAGLIEAAAVQMTPGTYSGAAYGMKSTVCVDVTVDETSITAIEITDSEETTGIGQAAFAEVPDAIIEHQSLNVDAATGATMTSNAIKNAVAQAITEAGGDPDAFRTPVEETVKAEGETEDYDIVIVGAGMAGMSAAIEAARTSEASVLVLEKLAYTGGSARVCGGGIWTINSDYNEIMGQDSTLEEYISFNEEYAGHELNEGLMEHIYNIDNHVITYYMEHDLPVSTDGWSLGNPDSQLPVMWSVNGSNNAESGLAQCLEAMCDELGVEIRLNSKVTELVHDETSVSGVVVEDDDAVYTVNAKKVILATGGFTQNDELIEELAPEYTEALHFTNPGAEGDGFYLTEDWDINIVGEGMMGLMGTTANNGYYFNEGPLVWGPTISVNAEGEEFGLAEAFYGRTLKLIEDQTGHCAYGIFDSASWALDQLEVYTETGAVTKYDTLDELAEDMGIDAENLKATAEAKELAEGPYYCLVINPCFIGSIPSLEVDSDCRLITSDGAAIENLYAAGELICGNYYSSAYPASGTGIGTSTYTGAIAAETAVAELNK